MTHLYYNSPTPCSSKNPSYRTQGEGMLPLASVSYTVVLLNPPENDPIVTKTDEPALRLITPDRNEIIKRAHQPSV